MAFIAQYWLSISVGLLVACAVAVSHRLFLSKKLASHASDCTVPVGTDWVYPTEKRKSLRRYGNPTAIHIGFPDSDSHVMVGYVVDRSHGGLGILVDREFDSGTSLVVRPEKSFAITPWCDIEVLACQKDGPQWKLSCRFINPPSYAILLLFG